MKERRMGFFAIPLALLAIAGFSAVVMLLWNALLPSIFGMVSINFWQALGLLILARILFGGLGAGAKKHAHPGNKYMREKWMAMTPEQRKMFIDKRKHFGFEENFEMDEHIEAAQDNGGGC